MWTLTLWNSSKFFLSIFSRCPFVNIFPCQNFVPYGITHPHSMAGPPQNCFLHPWLKWSLIFEGSSLWRNAALLAETPSSSWCRFKVPCICLSLHCFLTQLRKFCNGLVVEQLEQLKPSSYLTWNSKENGAKQSIDYASVWFDNITYTN